MNFIQRVLPYGILINDVRKYARKIIVSSNIEMDEKNVPR